MKITSKAKQLNKTQIIQTNKTHKKHCQKFTLVADTTILNSSFDSTIIDI